MDIIKREALTKLTRICQINPDNIRFLKKVLSEHLESCAFFAVEVARETGGPIGEVLAECLAESGSHSLLRKLYESLPAESVVLREVHLVIAKRMVEDFRHYEADDWKLAAESKGAYALALSRAGERETALEYALQSACLYQRFMPASCIDRLNSFSRLAECLMQTGRMDEALLAQAETLEGCEASPFSPATESSLYYAHNLLVMSSYFRMLEEPEEALGYGQKAAETILQAPAHSVEKMYIHHRIIRNLAACHEQLGKLKKAQRLLRNNLQTIRDLYDYAPDNYALELIDTLETLASIECRMGSKETAISIAHEALQHLQTFYQRRPQAFSEHYASILANVSLIEWRCGNLHKALQDIDTAINLLEDLYQQYPERFASLLARALNNRVEIHLASYKHTEAIYDAYRALCLYRSMRRHDADIASTFSTLAHARIRSGELFKAQRSIQACIRIYRRLVVMDDSFRVDLTVTLGTLAFIQEQSRKYSDALVSADEALAYWDNAPAYLKEAYAQNYYCVAKVRLICLLEVGMRDKALTWLNTVLEHIRQNQHDCLHFNLLNSITRFCFLQAHENPRDVLASLKKTVKFYNNLPEPLSLRKQAEKVLALLSQGCVAYICGQNALSIASFQQALPYQRQIVLESADYHDEVLRLLQALSEIHLGLGNSKFSKTLNKLKLLLDQKEYTELFWQLELMESAPIVPKQARWKSNYGEYRFPRPQRGARSF